MKRRTTLALAGTFAVGLLLGAAASQALEEAVARAAANTVPLCSEFYDGSKPIEMPLTCRMCEPWEPIARVFGDCVFRFGGAEQ